MKLEQKISCNQCGKVILDAEEIIKLKAEIAALNELGRKATKALEYNTENVIGAILGCLFALPILIMVWIFCIVMIKGCLQ